MRCTHLRSFLVNARDDSFVNLHDDSMFNVPELDDSQCWVLAALDESSICPRLGTMMLDELYLCFWKLDCIPGTWMLPIRQSILVLDVSRAKSPGLCALRAAVSGICGGSGAGEVVGSIFRSCHPKPFFAIRIKWEVADMALRAH